MTQIPSESRRLAADVALLAYDCSLRPKPMSNTVTGTSLRRVTHLSPSLCVSSVSSSHSDCGIWQINQLVKQLRGLIWISYDEVVYRTRLFWQPDRLVSKLIRDGTIESLRSNSQFTGMSEQPNATTGSPVCFTLLWRAFQKLPSAIGRQHLSLGASEASRGHFLYSVGIALSVRRKCNTVCFWGVERGKATLFDESVFVNLSALRVHRVRTVMENLEKSCNFKMVISRPGKVMDKT